MTISTLSPVRQGGSIGKVYLVGAGPGSPDLITVRGLRLLSQADVVAHDALIHPELLENVRPEAERLFVGKRGFCIGSTRQESIHELLINRAMQGLTVVRLKCGDPCVFGRGGEEAEYLAEHNVPFEIVPGVTTAVGACAASNIPLTHRDVGQTICLVTGHFDPESPDCKIDWSALARLGQVVIYMGLRHLAKIATRLMDVGMAKNTPVAVIENATLPNMRVVDGELATITALAEMAQVAAPAIIVVGEAVRYRRILMSLNTSLEGAIDVRS